MSKRKRDSSCRPKSRFPPLVNLVRIFRNNETGNHEITPECLKSPPTRKAPPKMPVLDSIIEGFAIAHRCKRQCIKCPLETKSSSSESEDEDGSRTIEWSTSDEETRTQYRSKLTSKKITKVVLQKSLARTRESHEKSLNQGNNKFTQAKMTGSTIAQRSFERPSTSGQSKLPATKSSWLEKRRSLQASSTQVPPEAETQKGLEVTQPIALYKRHQRITITYFVPNGFLHRMKNLLHEMLMDFRFLEDDFRVGFRKGTETRVVGLESSFGVHLARVQSTGKEGHIFRVVLDVKMAPLVKVGSRIVAFCTEDLVFDVPYGKTGEPIFVQPFKLVLL